MTDPWNAMEDEDDETYSGADAYIEGDDDDQLAELDIQVDEIEQLEDEAEIFRSFRQGAEERLLSVLPASSLARIFQIRVRGLVDDEDDDGESGWSWSSSNRTSGNWFEKVTKPQPEGVKLLMSGDFGRVRHRVDSHQHENLFSRLHRTASGARSVYKEDLIHDMIPNTHGTAVASYTANVYCGQYSTDSSLYYTCRQDFWLHVYDTKAPLKISGQRYVPRRYAMESDNQITNMATVKSIRGVHGNWTITDSHLSPDNQRMIYSSMAPTVYMTHTQDSSAEQTPISFADPNTSRSYGTAIWCCRFSADGNEVFAGGSGPIFVYDLIANQRTVKIQSAHSDDVNSCCWADTASGNVLVSGSDDGFIKVWDRRSLGVAEKPSGVLVGHTEGITYVSAKGDGRYIISNGKDQALRLWDLRKMRTNEEFDQIRHNEYAMGHFDYRQGHYPKPKVLAHPKDCSVMTYRGHEVLRTLIRCHFSPMETTGAQYLYSGSHDGKIHIWSLDGRVVQILDRSKTLPISVHPSEPEPAKRDSRPNRSKICVRDVSWHSQEPVLMSAAWESRSGPGSVVARHEWKGLSRGGSLEDWLEKKNEEAAEIEHRSAGYRQMPGSYLD